MLQESQILLIVLFIFILISSLVDYNDVNRVLGTVTYRRVRESSMILLFLSIITYTYFAFSRYTQGHSQGHVRYLRYFDMSLTYTISIISLGIFSAVHGVDINLPTSILLSNLVVIFMIIADHHFTHHNTPLSSHVYLAISAVLLSLVIWMIHSLIRKLNKKGVNTKGIEWIIYIGWPMYIIIFTLHMYKVVSDDIASYLYLFNDIFVKGLFVIILSQIINEQTRCVLNLGDTSLLF
jgi:hypothetical protein